jgi:hypothetical protein
MKFITKKNHLLNYFLNFLLAILIFSFRTLRKRHYVIAKITLVWLVPFFFLLITYPFIIHAGYDLNQDGRIDPFESCLRQEVGSACANPLGKLCDYHYPFTRYPVGAVRDASCTDTPPRCTAGISWGSDARVVCVQKGKCYNNDGDSRRNCPGWAQPEDKDCDDSDPWSHVFASANIASINIPAGISYSPLDYISGTITFTKKCGLTTPTPKALDISIYLVKPNGSEVHVGDRLYKKTDFVYEFSVGLSALFNEEDIALISKNPYGFKLKFVGPGLVDPYTGTTLPNKDRVIIKDIPKYASIRMTNCGRIYGSGKHKMIFMRSSDVSLEVLKKMTYKSIEDGFKTTEPFKTYSSPKENKFSFFIDLTSNPIYGFLESQLLSKIKNSSACGPFGSMYTYFDYHKTDDDYPSISGVKSGVSVINLADESETGVSDTVLHEVAHGFGGLFDEYVYEDVFADVNSPEATKSFKFLEESILISRTNCSSNPPEDYFFNGRLYGALDKKGCTLKIFFRPSKCSLMDTWSLCSYKFNVVSCGWLLKAIKGGSAKSHFPECAEMAKRGEVEF